MAINGLQIIIKSLIDYRKGDERGRLIEKAIPTSLPVSPLLGLFV
jgi:hypothetical protein